MKAVSVPIEWRPDLSIYASEAFLSSVSDEYGWLGGTDDSGKVRCMLPYTIVRKLMFRMVRFRVETIALEGELERKEERAFLNSAMSYFRARGADLVVPASTNTIFRTYPDGSVAAPYGSYVIDLTQPEETLWNNLHAKHRNVVRNAMKRGVEIRTGPEHLGTVHRLIQGTLKRSHLSFMTYGGFERFMLDLGERVKLFVAEYQGTAQGCAVVPYSLHSAYYLYAGSVPEPLTGAMNLLTWEAMRLFRGMGVRRYDFVGARINPEKGSKQDGLRVFKERFGGRLHQGYMWKFSFNRFKYWAYCAAARIKKGGDIVDLERHKLAHEEGRTVWADSNGEKPPTVGPYVRK
jgi:hypothetical protein